MGEHGLDSIEWVASVSGSGFVAMCACGFESPAGRTREDAIALVTSHALTAPAPARRAWLRRRTTVVDLRDPVSAR